MGKKDDAGGKLLKIFFADKLFLAYTWLLEQELVERIYFEEAVYSDSGDIFMLLFLARRKR